MSENYTFEVKGEGLNMRFEVTKESMPLLEQVLKTIKETFEKRDE